MSESSRGARSGGGGGECKCEEGEEAAGGE